MVRRESRRLNRREKGDYPNETKERPRAAGYAGVAAGDNKNKLETQDSCDDRCRRCVTAER